jgi:hypothetical protein
LLSHGNKVEAAREGPAPRALAFDLWAEGPRKSWEIFFEVECLVEKEPKWWWVSLEGLNMVGITTCSSLIVPAVVEELAYVIYYPICELPTNLKFFFIPAKDSGSLP